MIGMLGVRPPYKQCNCFTNLLTLTQAVCLFVTPKETRLRKEVVQVEQSKGLFDV